MDNTNVLFTFIIGDYDILKEPVVISEGWDYVCVTDNPNLYSSRNWNILKVKNHHVLDCNKKTAMNIMMNCYEYLEKKYQLVITTGAQITINLKLNKFLDKYNFKKNMDGMLIKHPKYNCVYKASHYVVGLNKDKRENVESQMKRYRDNKFPEKFGLFSSGIMVINLTSEKIKKFLKIWSNEYVKAESLRDQLCMSYAMWIYQKNYQKLNIGELDYKLMAWTRNKDRSFDVSIVGHKKSKL